MQNQELGRHSDKIWADSTTQKTLRYLTIYSVDLPNLPKYLRYLKKEKNLSLVPVFRG